MDVESAFKKFFGGAGYPKFKRKYAAWQSFQAPQHVEATKNKIKLPKIGWVDCVMHRDLPKGKIKTCTIKRAPSGKYFISVLVEQQVSEVIPCVIEEDKTIGVDVGIKTFAVCSDGSEIQNPRLLDCQLVSLKLAQRVFSRLKKGSKNRSKQKMVVAKLHEKVANARHDFIHKSSYNVAVKNHATTVCIEDLQISNNIKRFGLQKEFEAAGSVVTVKRSPSSKRVSRSHH